MGIYDNIKFTTLGLVGDVSGVGLLMKRQPLRFCTCGEEIEAGRFASGYKTCLRCGEKEAQAEIEAKKLRTAPLYNKGGYMYLGKGEAAKQNALDVGRKTSAGEAKPGPVLPVVVTARDLAPKKNERPKQRLQIGIYWSLNGDSFVLWEGQKVPSNAVRSIIFDSPRSYRPYRQRKNKA